MKKYFLLVCIAALALAGCKKDGGKASAITVDFTISKNPCRAQEEVTFTAKLTGGKAPFTCTWELFNQKSGAKMTTLSGETASYTFESNGTVAVKLTVTDAAGTTAQRQKNLVVNPAPVPETDNITLHWAAKIDGYTSISSVAIADDGSVYATSRARKLYKFNSSGTKQWEQVIFTSSDAESAVWSTPSIDVDGTVYVGGGTKNPDGCYVAFNPDGSKKWTFTDFFTNAEKLPTVTGIIAGIDGDHIYIGNTGTTGSVLSINKADGSRAGYCKHGDGGPVGGARTGIAISNKGTLHWYGGEYGAFGMSKSVLDAATTGGDYNWRMYGEVPERAKMSAMCPLTLTTIGSKSALVGIVTDQIGVRVYALDVTDGSEISSTYIDDTYDQDQGGVVITPEGYGVASLCYELGAENGGIAIIDLAQGEVLARYRVQEKVSGSAAIDAAGNIHFGTEDGFYYIVKYASGEFTLLAKMNLARLIVSDSRYPANEYDYQANKDGALMGKIWNSVVIGDDGKMYCIVTDEDTRGWSALVCLGYAGCAGPGNTPWPMVGHDRRHTNKQL